MLTSTLLTDSCAGASRCLALPRRSDGSSPPSDVYVPTDPDKGNGIIAVLSSTQNVLIIAAAILAIGLFAGLVWSDRRRSAAESGPGSSDDESADATGRRRPT